MEFLPDVGVSPNYGMGKGGEFDTQVIGLGDGYRQRRPTGLNSFRRSWTLEWGLLSKAQAETLYDFLTGLLGVYAFLWNEPDSDRTYKVTCPKVPSLKAVDFNIYSLSAEFEEDLNP